MSVSSSGGISYGVCVAAVVRLGRVFVCFVLFFSGQFKFETFEVRNPKLGILSDGVHFGKDPRPRELWSCTGSTDI